MTVNKMNGKDKDTLGFSLLEAMLSIAVFLMIVVGLSKGLVMARSVAETNIREVTANAAASGYLEQIKSMEYPKILESVRDHSVPIPTVLSLGEPDPIYLDQWMTKQVVIDKDPDTGHERLMPFHVRMEIDDLSPSGEGDAVAITVFYAWEDAKTWDRRERSLRTIRSLVPTF